MTDQRDDAEGTWARSLGMRVVTATAAEVVIELEIGPQHTQAFGLIHGGVHCSLIESAASMGANIVARARGQEPALGLENHTSFVRAASAGLIRATATPLHTGRTSQLWEAKVCDEEGKVLATGRVRLLCSSRPKGGS